MRFTALLMLLIAAVADVAVAADAPTTAPAASGAPIEVSIQIDASKTIGKMNPAWSFWGADEPNYAYMKDGQKLMEEIGQIGSPAVYFRAHNLLTTGDGTPALKWGSTNAYTEDAKGNPVYSWTILDKIFDTYLKNGIRPYAEIGFMPEAMSTHPDPYQHHFTPGGNASIFTGWAYPPKDYGKWGELAHQWVLHDVDRYGKAEVEKWWWEVWNEPNIGYWKGTPEEFFKLHDYAVDGVRRALPTARVGGPDCAGAGGAWLKNFLNHCVNGINDATGQKGTPIDFVSFHCKGSPSYPGGHVRMGISNQLRAFDGGFATVASFPTLKDKPIVAGESDPDGCAACTGNQLGYRTTTMFSSYTADCVAHEYELADRDGVNFAGAVNWSFEMEGQAPFAGFRTMATDGIDLPVLNALRMFGKMSGQRVAVQSSAGLKLADILRAGVRDNPDISSIASIDGKKLAVMVWYYHDDDLPGPDANVSLTVNGLPQDVAQARLQHFRVDSQHSDATTVWQQMGSPKDITPEQHAQLEKAGQLATIESPATVDLKNGQATLKFNLPRQGVSLLVLNWD